LIALTVAAASTGVAGREPDHRALHTRGEQARGFDQTTTVLHFFLYDDGGAIEVTVKDRADKKNLAAVRTHLPHIVQAFRKGDFSDPAFAHGVAVPGTETMARLRDRIGYTYEDIRDGGRVRISTRHARTFAAVHEFLRSQIQEYKTGDSLDITRPPKG
jgi:hypothetical protein